MKVSDIYHKYQVPKGLQEHMIRVAALAQIICESWKGEGIDKDSIIQACLFHDIAKPMVFDLAKQAQYGMSEEDIESLKKHQEDLKFLYGDDEHHATVKICVEVGCSSKAVKLIDDLEWDYIPRLLEKNNSEALIPIYCDMRIGIKGVLLLQERLDDLRKRTGEDKDNVAENGNKVENFLKEKVSIDLNSVADVQLNEKFESFLNMDIKHAA